MSFKKHIVISDIHIPFHSKTAQKALLKFIRDFQPDGLTINGDAIEADEFSTHTAGSVAHREGRRFFETCNSANEYIDALEDAGGRKMIDKTWRRGNHCDRLSRWLAKGDNAIFLDDPLISIEERLHLTKRKFKIHLDVDGYHKLGHLYVTHGRWSTATAHINRYKHSVLIGHIHTPQMIYASTIKGPCVVYVAGHMANAEHKTFDYASKPRSWQNGFAVVYVKPSGDFNCQLINFHNGSFFYGGKEY